MSEEGISKQKIIEWLNKTGYPLEMRVSKYLSDNFISNTQSTYYLDFEAGTKREIDLLTRSYKSHEPFGEAAVAELEIFTAIECKAHQNKPWIFFKSDDNPLWEFEVPISNKDGHLLLRKSDNLLMSSIFTKLTKTCSSGVNQAFASKGNDVPYKATMGALKAAEAKAIEALDSEKNFQRDDDLDEERHAICVLPIVVTDARLFEASLSDTGNTHLEEVEYASVAMRYPRSNDRYPKSTVVFVFKESSLETMVKELKKFTDVMEGNLSEILLTVEKDNSKKA